MNMKHVTLLFLLRDGRILLAMKKRGFGAGKWNGVGGKQDPGETVLQAAVRECQEEIEVTPIEPRLVGTLDFYDQADPDFNHFAHIYVAKNWEGEPAETEEMRPQWFKTGDIPYAEMWADDIFWLPLALDGKLFEGTVTLDGDNGDKLASHDIHTVEKLA